MILEKKAFKVDDNMDFIEVKFGNLSGRLGYRLGFQIDHYLRMAAKKAARHHRAPATFYYELDLPERGDNLRPNKLQRQSNLTPSFKEWSVSTDGALVTLWFDNNGIDMDYETAAKLGRAIRNASHRARAWAGDHTKYRACLGNLTDAEEDYKLGLA